MQSLEFVTEKNASYSPEKNRWIQNLKYDLEFRIRLFSMLLNTPVKICIFSGWLAAVHKDQVLNSTGIAVINEDLPESAFLKKIIEPVLTRNSLLIDNFFPDNSIKESPEIAVIPLISENKEILGVILAPETSLEKFRKEQIEMLWTFNRKFPINQEKETSDQKLEANQAEELKLIHQVIQQEIGFPLQNLKKTVRRLENETEPLLSPSVYQCVLDIESQVNRYLGVIDCLGSLKVEKEAKDAEYLDLDAIVRSLANSVSFTGEPVAISNQIPFIRACAVEISEALRIILKTLVENRLPQESISVNYSSESGIPELDLINQSSLNTAPASFSPNFGTSCHSIHTLIAKKLLLKNGIGVSEISEKGRRGYKLTLPATE